MITDTNKLIEDIEAKIVDLGALEVFNAEAHLYSIKNAAFREAIDLIRKHSEPVSGGKWRTPDEGAFTRKDGLHSEHLSPAEKMVEQTTPADETMRDSFSKTIQALIDFVCQNKHYSGELTTDTACQLLRDIELDALKVAKPAMSRESVLILINGALRNADVSSYDSCSRDVLTALAEAGVLNVRKD